MKLVLAGVVTMVAFAIGAPSATAALPSTPALPAQQTVQAAQATAASAVGAVQQQAATGAAATQQAASHVATPPVDPPSVKLPSVRPPRVEAPRVKLPQPPAAVDTSGVDGVGREIGAYRKKIVPPPVAVPHVKAIDDVVALVGNTLRHLAPPVASLLAPVAPLLNDLRGGFDLPRLLAAVEPGEAHTLSATAEHGAPAPPPPASAVVPPATGARGPASQTFQAASARPPAAEVGGRPVSPPPRTAPAPVAGGAAPSSSGGLFFVPLLGLLVLAALAAPRLLRRLDELPAFVRPQPFLCALERPG